MLRGKPAGAILAVPGTTAPARAFDAEALSGHVDALREKIKTTAALPQRTRRDLDTLLAEGAYFHAAFLLNSRGKRALAAELERGLSSYLSAPENIASFEMMPTNPMHVNEAWKVVYKNGVRAIFKPEFEAAKLDAAELPRGAHAEVDAYRLDRRIGFDQGPVTVDGALPDGRKGSVQHWVETDARRDEMVRVNHPNRFNLNTMSLIKVKVFDFLIGGTDRGYSFGGRNLLRVGPAHVAIDHGWSFLPAPLQRTAYGEDAEAAALEASPVHYSMAVAGLTNDQRNLGKADARAYQRFVAGIGSLGAKELRSMLAGRHSEAAIDQIVHRQAILADAFRHVSSPEVKALPWYELLASIQKTINRTY